MLTNTVNVKANTATEFSQVKPPKYGNLRPQSKQNFPVEVYSQTLRLTDSDFLHSWNICIKNFTCPKLFLTFVILKHIYFVLNMS